MCVCSLSPAVIEDQGKILGTRKRDMKTSRIQEYAGIGSYTRVLCAFQMAKSGELYYSQCTEQEPQV